LKVEYIPAEKIMQPKLKPCKDCGSAKIKINDFGSGCFFVFCVDCEYGLPAEDSKKEAIKAWNDEPRNESK